MKDFRIGGCNTLIATCVAEEGIDVGEVDLIICFDINNKNPTRFVQRIGRTGRKRQGKVRKSALGLPNEKEALLLLYFFFIVGHNAGDGGQGEKYAKKYPGDKRRNKS